MDGLQADYRQYQSLRWGVGTWPLPQNMPGCLRGKLRARLQLRNCAVPPHEGGAIAFYPPGKCCVRWTEAPALCPVEASPLHGLLCLCLKALLPVRLRLACCRTVHPAKQVLRHAVPLAYLDDSQLFHRALRLRVLQAA